MNVQVYNNNYFKKEIMSNHDPHMKPYVGRHMDLGMSYNFVTA